jgi:dTDP-4-dehydrorhamnose reductase
LILGSTGMLGLAVSEAFKEFNGDVFATARPGSQRSHSLRTFEFDAERFSLETLPVDWAEGDYIINCIGIIRSEIDESSPESVRRAKKINTDFSVELAKFAEKKGLRVIQIATDCVFSGHTGNYVESSPHDPTDVYGKTKSAGESDSKSVQHLRVSIIGPENRSFTSLLSLIHI